MGGNHPTNLGGHNKTLIILLKLLILSQYFWPENFRINDLATGLKARGHDVTVLTGMPNYPGGKLFDGYSIFKPARETYKGIPVSRVPLARRGKGRGWQLALNYASFMLSGSILGPWRCRGDYDCILVYEPSPITIGLPAIAMKKKTGAPVLFWVQDLWPESLSATGAVRSEWVLNRVKTLVRFIYRHCDRILVQSEAFKHPIVSMGVDPRRLEYYPNSAESLYKPVRLPADASEREQIPDGFKVMFAGNIGAAQDFPTILETAERLQGVNDIHFIILGDGRRFSWLKSEVVARGLKKNFHLLGRYPVTQMPRFFALADALLVTLKRDPIFEMTIPSKVQSYMACARPVVAGLDGEGARVVAKSGGGLVAPTEAPAKLAQAIKTLYEMPADQRSKMGASGLKYFQENFERHMLLDRLESIMAGTVKEVSG